MNVKLDVIRKTRFNKGYTQEDMAFELQISQSQYNRLENGENKFSLEKLSRVLEILELKPNEIVHFNKNEIDFLRQIVKIS